MAFDVTGARLAGYSDAEIADHLAPGVEFDLAGARKGGYSDQEIVDYLVPATQAKASVEGPKGPQTRGVQKPPPPELSEGQKWVEAGKNVASMIARPLAKAAWAPVGMIGDAGIQARAFAENPHVPTLAEMSPFTPEGRSAGPYPTPSSIFEQQLDAVTRPPTTLGGKAQEFVGTMLAGAGMPTPPMAGARPGTLPGGAQDFAPAVPQNFVSGGNGLRQQVMQSASREGYVAPPSSINPTGMNRLLEGVAGKQKLGMMAQERNQAVTDALSARAVGENSGAPVTPGALQAIRGEAAASGYAPLRGAGSITTDAPYLAALDKITAGARGAEKSFPGIKPASPIDDTITALRQEKFDAGDGVDAIAHLREQADNAYRSGNSALGKQYKQAATAIEDVIQRDLTGRGKDGAALVKAFQDARTQIAKTYTASKAAVGDSGQFNASTYASELSRGKPLTGDQRTIGNFAQSFGRYVKKPSGETVPSVSPLDVYGSSIAAGTTGSALPFAFPLSRAALREYLLSPSAQQRAVQGATASPGIMGVSGAAIPAWNQFRGLFAQ